MPLGPGQGMGSGLGVSFRSLFGRSNVCIAANRLLFPVRTGQRSMPLHHRKEAPSILYGMGSRVERERAKRKHVGAPTTREGSGNRQNKDSTHSLHSREREARPAQAQGFGFDRRKGIKRASELAAVGKSAIAIESIPAFNYLTPPSSYEPNKGYQLARLSVNPQKDILRDKDVAILVHYTETKNSTSVHELELLLVPSEKPLIAFNLTSIWNCRLQLKDPLLVGGIRESH
ncbi:pentatricopeptide repeat (PPR) superfamily protein [Striga asiatica]|uniref:Pentatricopeptide repeat (PPR) superfamily protein n=1 Tax=Striga asiatica TaxID=4170 RepID=A0A5A7Q1W3_STRAF|nr:pentatricopeptide repeat (PPR) superfamily protein [Striga asiatica]